MAEADEKSEVGFVEMVKTCLNQLVEPDGYYDDEFSNFNERRIKLLAAEGLPHSDIPDCPELVPIPNPKYVENPAPDNEVLTFDKKKLSANLLQFKFGDAIPFDDAQKEFLEKSREHWKSIGENEKRMFEEHFGENAKQSIYHPDNRGHLPFWMPQP